MVRASVHICIQVTGGVSQQDEVVCENDSCIAYANMLKQNMDTTVDPCVDFYDYVCMGYVDQPLRSDEVCIRLLLCESPSRAYWFLMQIP